MSEFPRLPHAPQSRESKLPIITPTACLDRMHRDAHLALDDFVTEPATVQSLDDLLEIREKVDSHIACFRFLLTGGDPPRTPLWTSKAMGKVTHMMRAEVHDWFVENDLIPNVSAVDCVILRALGTSPPPHAFETNRVQLVAVLDAWYVLVAPTSPPANMADCANLRHAMRSLYPARFHLCLRQRAESRVLQTDLDLWDLMYWAAAAPCLHPVSAVERLKATHPDLHDVVTRMRMEAIALATTPTPQTTTELHVQWPPFLNPTTNQSTLVLKVNHSRGFHADKTYQVALQIPITSLRESTRLRLLSAWRLLVCIDARFFGVDVRNSVMRNSASPHDSNADSYNFSTWMRDFFVCIMNKPLDAPLNPPLPPMRRRALPEPTRLYDDRDDSSVPVNGDQPSESMDAPAVPLHRTPDPITSNASALCLCSNALVAAICRFNQLGLTGRQSKSTCAALRDFYVTRWALNALHDKLRSCEPCEKWDGTTFPRISLDTREIRAHVTGASEVHSVELHNRRWLEHSDAKGGATHWDPATKIAYIMQQVCREANLDPPTRGPRSGPDNGVLTIKLYCINNLEALISAFIHALDMQLKIVEKRLNKRHAIDERNRYQTFKALT